MRDNRIDVIKGILITLVVFGHCLEIFDGWNGHSAFLLTAIYIFHMPAFAYISGVTNKSDSFVKKSMYFFTVFLIFQCIYGVIRKLIYDDTSILIFLSRPYWILWYLWSLCSWVISAHYLNKTKYPILLSIILSLLVGLTPIDGYHLGFSRTFVFLPFFMAGMKYKMRPWDKLSGGYLYVLPVFVIISILIYRGGFNHPWLSGANTYYFLGVGVFEGTLFRGFLLISSVICGFIVIHIINQLSFKIPTFFSIKVRIA